MFWVIIIFVSSYAIHVNAYVLLQVRKQNDSVSKIDALIHKILPNDQVAELKNRFEKRALKSVSEVSLDKPIGRQRIKKMSSHRKPNVRKLSTDKKIGGQVTEERSLESVVLSGVKNMVAHEKRPALIDNISKKILDFVKKNAGPIFRSNTEQKPEVIHLEDSNVMLKLDSDTVLNLINNALKSNTFQVAVNQLAKGAAETLRTIRDSTPVDAEEQDSNDKT